MVYLYSAHRFRRIPSSHPNILTGMYKTKSNSTNQRGTGAITFDIIPSINKNAPMPMASFLAGVAASTLATVDPARVPKTLETKTIKCALVGKVVMNTFIASLSVGSKEGGRGCSV